MNFTDHIRTNAQTLWHVQRVKQLTRAVFNTGPLTLITVVETECEDPECPGPITEVTLLGPDTVRQIVTLHLPLKEIAASDLQTAVSGRQSG